MTTILPNTTAINCAIGTQNDLIKFYESSNLLNNNDIGLVSSLVADETERWRKTGIKYVEYEIDCYTWDFFR